MGTSSRKVAKPEHGSLEWLRLRHRDEDGRVRFGASEAPVLMGASKYRSLLDLSLDKLAEPEVTEPNAAMMRGNILEPSLIAYAQQVLGEPVETPTEMYVNGRIIATLDGLSASNVIVECKTTTAYSSDDDLPDDYLWQVTAQFACVPEAQEAVVIVLDKRMRLGVWHLRRNESLIADLMLQAERVGDALDRQELPSSVTLTEKAAKVLYPDPAGEIELGEYALNAIERIRHHAQLKADAAEKEQEARDELAAVLGSAEAGLANGRRVVTFKARAGAKRVDLNRLRADHPELVRQYEVQGAGTRILRITD